MTMSNNTKTFDEILKFNPYHDRLGRFTTSGGASSFTYAPGKSKAHDNAIQNEKQSAKGFKGTLYHGSPETDIEEFDIGRAGKNTSSGEKLIYFTDSKQMADDFSYERLDGSTMFTNRRGKKGRVYEVDVEMKNPLDFRNLSDTDIDNILKLDIDGILTKDMVKMYAQKNHQLLKSGLEITAESLKSLGYDGLIANTGKAGHNSLEYAVVDSKQAKIRKSEVTKNMTDCSIMKTDDDKRLVFGWASISITVDGVQLEDRQQDMIDPEDLEEAAYEYVLNFRDTGEEHISTMRKKGKLVESCVFTAEKQKAMGIPEGTLPVGWWIGFKIDDDAAWEKVKNGTYRMFSIEGRANREPVEKSRRDYDEYPSYDMWLEENLEHATIEEQKAAKEYFSRKRSVAKSFDEILKFNPYHDSKGRFTTSNGAASFTYSPGKSKAHDNAIAREKERQNANGGTSIDGVDISAKLPDPIDYDGFQLPELQGSEKQKKWAEDIRDDAIDHMNTVIATVNGKRVGNDFMEAARSKEAMTEYIRNHNLVKMTDGAVRQQKIDGICDNFNEYARRYAAGTKILSNADAKYWIDNRPNQVANAHYKKFDGIINGVSKSAPTFDEILEATP